VTLLVNGLPDDHPFGPADDDAERRMLLGSSWGADICESSALRARLLILASPERKAAYEQTMEDMTRCARLVIGDTCADELDCQSCGQRLPQEAVYVGADVDGHEAIWCVSCIDAVLQRAREAIEGG
jgi:hypothetical protein